MRWPWRRWWCYIHRYAQYSHFKIYSEADYYKLEIDGYEGNAGDSLNDPWYGSNNSPFSTYNRDNDRSSLNCASMLKVSACGRWPIPFISFVRDVILHSIILCLARCTAYHCMHHVIADRHKWYLCMYEYAFNGIMKILPLAHFRVAGGGNRADVAWMACIYMIHKIWPHAKVSYGSVGADGIIHWKRPRWWFDRSRRRQRDHWHHRAHHLDHPHPLHQMHRVHRRQMHPIQQRDSYRRRHEPAAACNYTHKTNKKQSIINYWSIDPTYSLFFLLSFFLSLSFSLFPVRQWWTDFIAFHAVRKHTSTRTRWMCWWNAMKCAHHCPQQQQQNK